jgi:gas vesicle protein
MPTSRTELQNTVDELEGTVQQVSDLVDEALDPELSREELVAKVKEIQEAVSEEAEEEPGE